MENQFFEITFREDNGGIESIVLAGDPAEMNWTRETWGVAQDMETESVKITDEGCKAVYLSRDLKLTVKRQFDEKGWLEEIYTLENRLDFDYYLQKGQLGISVPFADVYDNADYCMTNRCHAHVWCGGSTTYVKALRMGCSDLNLGLVLTEGSVDRYSIKRDVQLSSNNRGVLIFHPSAARLAPHQTMIFGWKLFPHKGTEDFYRILKEETDSIIVKADHYTVFQGDPIHFTCEKEVTAITCNGEALPFKVTDRGTEVHFVPEALGEYVITLCYGEGKKTFLNFYVSLPLMELARRRAQFIAHKQQCRIKDSALYGAYLVYDNKEEEQFFDPQWHDLNACRERIGMALVIARYLQKNPDAELMDSLMEYDRFLRREFLDEQTGQVFNHVNRTNNWERLYNYPWVMMYMMETYLLTGEEERLEILARIVDHYYGKGGHKHYALALSLAEIVNTMYGAGRKDLADKVLEGYSKHVAQMVEIGLHYPKHEVNYEQTIVSPAATLITQYCQFADTPENRKASAEQISILERFNGQQPDYRLHETSIRHWDGYWFGKNKLYGDTMPHYWSSVTGWAFTQYAKLTGDETYRRRGEDNIRSTLCTFFPDGKASCAYLYPFRVNDRKGEYFDEYANDQDFSLYFALKVLG